MLDEITKIVAQAVVTSLMTLGLGLLVLRRQEQIRRDEEFFGAIRKMRADAFLKLFAAISKFAALHAEAVSWREIDEDEYEKASERAAVALDEVYLLRLESGLLLGTVSPSLDKLLEGVPEAIRSAEKQEVVMDHLRELRDELARHLPPMKPLR